MTALVLTSGNSTGIDKTVSKSSDWYANNIRFDNIMQKSLINSRRSSWVHFPRNRRTDRNPLQL